MTILAAEAQKLNPHLTNLRSLFEGKQTTLDWLVIAHNDPIIDKRLATVVGEQPAVMLQIPQEDWEIDSGSIREAIRWSIDEADVKHVLFVGHSKAEVTKAAATWIGETIGADEPRGTSTSYERLLAGARRLEDQIQQSKNHFVGQIDHVCADVELAEAFAAGKVRLHTLFYMAESGTFLIYNIGKGTFVPIV
jgi:hypothetical protein